MSSSAEVPGRDQGRAGTGRFGVSVDAMILMDGGLAKTDGGMNLICLNAGDLRGGGASHQCITSTATNACLKVSQLPIDRIHQFA